MTLEELELELMECARNMRRLSARTLERTTGNGQTPQHRQISESSLALEAELHDAIEQGHNSTRMLQSAMAGLRQQLQQGGNNSAVLEQWSGGSHHRREMKDEVERWKGRCKTLEDKAQRDESIQLRQIKNDRQNLRDENADLRRKLEQSEKELNGWKEDCMFFAVKFMSWGPSLLKWGPALHHEFERKLLQKRKKKNTNDNIIPDWTSKAHHNVDAGSLRSIFTGKSAVADLAKGCNSDDNATADYSWTSKLWSSKKRKCVSCSSIIMSDSGSPSNREFQR